MAILSNLTFLSRVVYSITFAMGSRARGTSPGLGDGYNSRKLIYPAATRNRQPILDVLMKEIPDHFNEKENLNFLEIASGSGQHISFFANNFPNITFQPTEYSSELLGSISIYAKECLSNNIREPKIIDISQKINTKESQLDNIDVIYCANMIHIAPYSCTIGLFLNAGALLSNGGLLITYGPYAINGVISPESNINFDKSLKSQNKEWGIRCLDELTKLAVENNLKLKKICDMPANNKCVLWEKVSV